MSRTTTTAAALVVGLLLAAGCGSSTPTTPSSGSAGSGQPGTTEKGSDYRIVSDAEVITGIAAVQRLAREVGPALEQDPAAAKQKVTAMYDAWFGFEGTVRKNDKSLYLDLEDGLALIKAGVDQKNPDKVAKGVGDFEKAATRYTAAHPG